MPTTMSFRIDILVEVAFGPRRHGVSVVTAGGVGFCGRTFLGIAEMDAKYETFG